MRSNFAHTRFMCRSSVKFASHEPTDIPQYSAISRSVKLPLLRKIVLTLRIISSFLDVDCRPERRSLSAEVLPSLNGRKQSNTFLRHFASSPYVCCNNRYVSVAVFFYFKRNVDANALFCTFTHNKHRCYINAHIISVTYYSQLCKRNHLQIVS